MECVSVILLKQAFVEQMIHTLNFSTLCPRIGYKDNPVEDSSKAGQDKD